MAADDPLPFDPATYGRSFADVYDAWYPPDAATAAAIDAVALLAGPGGSVLELGVGTGRLALPLAARGLAVIGVDASTAMLDVLAGKDPAGTVGRVLADIGDPDATQAHLHGPDHGFTAATASSTADAGSSDPRTADEPTPVTSTNAANAANAAGAWPSGPFDVVLAACNLVCNLTDPHRQAACIRGAADRLKPGGHLVVEAFEPAPLVAGPQLAVSEVRADAVVLIATHADPSTGVVVGNHVELRDGEPVRLRPWSIRAVAPAEIDRWAVDAGLELVRRTAGWAIADTGEGASTNGLVATYRKPTSERGGTDRPGVGP